MVMPGGISGRQLADRFLTDKPELRILFTSGYSQDMVEQESSGHKGVAFLQKPYPPQTLARAVRDCLDHPQD
jgi:FixJ family two-component response regulator